MTNTQNKRYGVTLLIVLALMVMFAMLVTAFMVIVTQQRRNSESIAKILIGTHAGEGRQGSSMWGGKADTESLDESIRLLLTGSSDLNNVVASHSILENFYELPGIGNPAALFTGMDAADKPFALRPNILAPDADGNQRYLAYLNNPDNGVRMNSDYTAPDYMTMFLAWNDFRAGTLERIIPSFHRPQLVNYWQSTDDPDDFNELRKYVLRPLPTDHPGFTGSNPAATVSNLLNFLTVGPWDVDNDGSGRANGVWLDIGLPARFDERTKSWYKPLVSYHIIDMESRINVNTISNPKRFAAPDEEIGAIGLGSAELSSQLLTDKVLLDRYGNDEVPGDDSLSPAELLQLLREAHGINLDAYTQGGLVADWFGTLPTKFDELGNRMGGKPLSDEEIRDIPYLMNPYSELTGDKPFVSDDLASLLQSIMETNCHRLSQRLQEALGSSYDANGSVAMRYNLTTRSSDIPVATKYVPVVDEDGKITGYETLEDRALRTPGLWELLPPEVQQGRKVDLNRLTLEPDWMTGGPDILKKKVRFAQEMFYLMQILFPEQATQTPEALERLAQWSVNLVDFIDADDVMTPFIFKKNSTPGSIVAFDNDVLIDKLLAGTLTATDLSDNDCLLIWGFEKSEVALTETFAVHNRNVRDMASNNIPQYRQTVRPYGVLFVELHRHGNSQRSYSASGLVEADGTLDLAKRTTNIPDANMGDYIWRLAIGEAIKTDASEFKWNEGSHPERNALQQLLTPENGIKFPQFYQWWYDDPITEGVGQYRPDLGVPDRFVWFGRWDDTDFPMADSDVRARSFVNVGETSVVLQPNSTLVVGSNSGFGGPWSPPDGTIIARFSPDPPVIMGLTPVMNASEPLPVIQGDQLVDGYAEKGAPSTTAPPFDDGVLRQRGTVACYKTICLQRLADPNRAHHPIGNPYLTVDWNMIDLQVINSPNVGSQNEEDIPKDGENIYFSSRKWKQTVSGFSNLWDRTLETIDDKAGLGFGTPEYYDDAGGTIRNQPDHSFGMSNFPSLTDTPFLHFPWHDAPLMNTGELMLVPASAPGRFGVEFHDNGTGTAFFGDTPRYSFNDVGPYLDWGKTDSDMTRLFDFVHVPTKFAGTRDDAGIVYREPGKFNLNTITEAGWEALANGWDDFPTYEEFRRSRHWGDVPGVAHPSEFRPFRSPSAVETPMEATWLGLNLIDDEADNPYLALENAMRLSDVTTAKSNVFAVWITVGYFEVEQFANLDDLRRKYPAHDFGHLTPGLFSVVYPDGYVLGAEKGLGDGTLRRHRAFYLIDRSTPVPYRRGEGLGSVQDVILGKALLE
ncbi:MAG: hypothetical protein FWE95_00515 [Planctomycetaceae bacterium]|nr:hypothetical protein [Planctomycetaceae bacterium]